MRFSKKTSRSITKERFYTYDNIKLRLYLQIAASGDYSQLITSGRADQTECYQAWEEIVKRNNEANNSYQFSAYFDSAQGYAKLIADYNTIKACLFCLLFEIDNDLISFLKEKGYHIDVESNSRTKYEESIHAAMRRSDNLITKIRMKQNELAMMADKGSGQNAGFEEIIANLSFMLGFTVNDDITLARYNEYRKIIKKKHDQLTKNKKSNG